MSSDRSDRPKNFPKFYIRDEKSNTWKVYFTNKAALSVKTVTDFFSKYGEIVKIDEVGRDFCFVHFRREEDARSCSWGMRNSSTIRLRPFKPTREQSREDSPKKTEVSSDKNGNIRRNGDVKSLNGAKENGRTSDTSTASKSSIYGLSSSSSASTESIPLAGSSKHHIREIGMTRLVTCNIF